MKLSRAFCAALILCASSYGAMAQQIGPGGGGSANSCSKTGSCTISGGWDFTGPVSFAGSLTVEGSVNVQSGTTYTFAATDCGQMVIFTSSSAVTATIPASIVPASGT